LEAGAEVVLLDSMAPEYGGNLFNIDGIESRVKVNISDVRDPHSMHYIVQGHDYLFILAGQTSTSIRCSIHSPIWASTAVRNCRIWKPAASTIRR
jgi:hypothetical protein